MILQIISENQVWIPRFIVLEYYHLNFSSVATFRNRDKTDNYRKQFRIIKNALEKKRNISMQQEWRNPEKIISWNINNFPFYNIGRVNPNSIMTVVQNLKQIK